MRQYFLKEDTACEYSFSDRFLEEYCKRLLTSLLILIANSCHGREGKRGLEASP